MSTPENVLNNKNEGNEKLNQNPENQESVESVEDMQKRLSQEITAQNEQLVAEDKKIETANDSIGLSGEEVQEEKTALNLDSEISSINADAEKLTTESKAELGSNLPVEKNENTSFLVEKGKEEKFDLLKSEFEKFYKEQPKQEYSLEELKSNLDKISSNPQAINGVLESLPKDIVEQLKSDNYSISAGAITAWQNSVGGQIGKLSNERVNVYSKSGEIIGNASKNSEEYLATVANASRFVPKEVSQKFVMDALNNFTNEEARNSTGARFIIANEQSRNQRNNIVRNLVEGGYSTEIKNFLSNEVKNKQMIPSEIFAYSKQGLFSEIEVKEILDQSGLLEEVKQEAKNESWG